MKKQKTKTKKKQILPTYISYFFEHVTPSAVPRRIFILLNQYWHPKHKPKFLKISPILFNFNQFNNCIFFLTNYFLTLFSCQKADKQSHNFFRSVCLTVRSPILLLKSWSQYMYPECPKKLWVRPATSKIFFCLIVNIFLEV